MLLSLLAFIISAVALFLSSQALLSRLYRLVKSINLIFFLLLPGIFLHEFSHILSAELLQVRTGALNLKPEFKDGHLTLGSAQIAQTDPFRLTLIGAAPFIAGVAVLWLLIKFNPGGWWQILFWYLEFTVANTLFSSPSDLQSAGIPLVLVLILLGVFQLTNINLPVSLLPFLTNSFSALAAIFGYTLIINLVLLLPLRLFSKKLA
ncbi:hypothetical protein KKE48_03745 [Patescibacteria group bacterium]|nr:hypothetical protein [Patescibacteria group bacterium]